MNPSLQHRVQSYLGNGGFFNPEMMEHEKVRDLIIALRDELQEYHDAVAKIDAVYGNPNSTPESLVTDLLRENEKLRTEKPMSTDDKQTIVAVLKRCAIEDASWARHYRFDAAECKKSDSERIRARAAGLLKRADEFDVSAAKSNNALASFQSEHGIKPLPNLLHATCRQD